MWQKGNFAWSSRVLFRNRVGHHEQMFRVRHNYRRPNSHRRSEATPHDGINSPSWRGSGCHSAGDGLNQTARMKVCLHTW